VKNFKKYWTIIKNFSTFYFKRVINEKVWVILPLFVILNSAIYIIVSPLTLSEKDAIKIFNDFLKGSFLIANLSISILFSIKFVKEDIEQKFVYFLPLRNKWIYSLYLGLTFFQIIFLILAIWNYFIFSGQNFNFGVLKEILNEFLEVNLFLLFSIFFALILSSGSAIISAFTLWIIFRNGENIYQLVKNTKFEKFIMFILNLIPNRKSFENYGLVYFLCWVILIFILIDFVLKKKEF